jgi:hypothetical protein
MLELTGSVRVAKFTVSMLLYVLTSSMLILVHGESHEIKIQSRGLQDVIY